MKIILIFHYKKVFQALYKSIQRKIHRMQEQLRTKTIKNDTPTTILPLFLTVAVPCVYRYYNYTYSNSFQPHVNRPFRDRVQSF